MEWRNAFADAVRRRRDAGICVVGNAGTLRGSALGAQIDRHGLVVRFNRFYGGMSETRDIGVRADVWVRAPDFAGAAPEEARWVIVSGPDMRYRLRSWGKVRHPRHLDVPVLTVPLPVWCLLVRSLGAPPSAGVLTLAWLQQLLGSWSGISAAGFGTEDAPTYHHAVPKQRHGRRHNWLGERDLLCQWQGEGLRIMSGR